MREKLRTEVQVMTDNQSQILNHTGCTYITGLILPQSLEHDKHSRFELTEWDYDGQCAPFIAGEGFHGGDKGRCDSVITHVSCLSWDM